MFDSAPMLLWLRKNEEAARGARMAIRLWYRIPTPSRVTFERVFGITSWDVNSGATRVWSGTRACIAGRGRDPRRRNDCDRCGADQAEASRLGIEKHHIFVKNARKSFIDNRL